MPPLFAYGLRLLLKSFSALFQVGNRAIAMAEIKHFRRLETEFVLLIYNEIAHVVLFQFYCICAGTISLFSLHLFPGE